jgi:hypothetical protein
MFKAQPNEDDEWINEEEKKPDLTGLKIQELVLNSDEEEEREEQEVEEEDREEQEVEEEEREEQEVEEGGETKRTDKVWGKKRAGRG